MRQEVSQHDSPSPTAISPIGIFDSGLGGLTVVRAIRSLLPAESLIYFGDTARVPYGIKSSQTVRRFAHENVRFLLRFQPKMIVVACNTASAAAMGELVRHFDLPVLGVVEPGAARAVELANGDPIGIVGTEATINSRAYYHAIIRHAPHIQVYGRACPLLVPLVEEGRSPDDPLVQLVLAEYLEGMLAQPLGALVLGCTHYPLLKEAFARIMGSVRHSKRFSIVDSAQETAREVKRRLESLHLEHPKASGVSVRSPLQCLVSDNPYRFRQLAQRFLGEAVDLELVSSDDFSGKNS